MKKNKKINWFKYIFFAFLFSFSIIYFGQLTGYYEFQNYNKKTLTEEQIKNFEEDVSNGKEIDINEYIVNTNVKYRNIFSKFTSDLSNDISNIVESGVKKTFKYLSNIMEEK